MNKHSDTESRSSQVSRQSTQREVQNSEIIEDDENMFLPNAYLEQDPKPILLLLADYCQQKAMKFLYRKNAHKLKFEVPMSETRQLDFWIIFEKGRKKSTKGLYRLKF